MSALSSLCSTNTASKCAFGVDSISDLEHIISIAGVAMDHDKLQAVADWHRP